MKYILTILILMFAQICNAQIIKDDPPNNGVEIECDAEHGLAIITAPVPKGCPHVDGVAHATVLDKEYKQEGKTTKVEHLIKSVSPCGCVTWGRVCECVPNGKYVGETKDMISTYKIKAKCEPKK
jgi:hypothetical protein